LAEAGIDTVVGETGKTLEENARLKAVALAAESGLAALADDSGLEVDALGGEPGPLSARYAGEGATDRERVSYLLTKLRGVPWESRTARFRCVIAVATPEGRVEFCSGECPGVITLEPAGSQGFGYDPVFYLPEMGKTMAELSLSEKNQLSHRGKAARQVPGLLKKMGLA
jgi:XTP/dITP diphosphohydrolase